MEWTYTEIITRLLLIILLALNALFLVKMIGRQSKLIKDQTTIIDDQTKHLDFLKKSYEERVNIVEEKAQEGDKKKKQELSLKEKELEEKIKTIKQARKLMSEWSINIRSLNFLIYKISLFFGAPPIIEKYINEMVVEQSAKHETLKSYKRAKQESNKMGMGVGGKLGAFFGIPGLFETYKNLPKK